MSDLKLSVIINAVDRLTQPVRKVVQTTDQLTQSVKGQRAELGRLGRVKEDIHHFRQLRQGSAATAQSLDVARQKATQLGKTLKQTARPTQAMKREFESARSSVRRLQQQHQAQQSQLQQLRQRMHQAGVSTRQLADGQRRLKQQTEQASQAMKQQSQRLESMQVARDRIGKGMATAANMMFVGHAAGQVGRTAAGLLSGPISTAVGFEAAMSGVGAVSRATSEEMTALTAKAKELGATTRYSAIESAQGMKYLAMAGFSTEQMMASLPAVMNMATAGAADLGRASDISSDILSAFGLQASDMGRVADTLTATFTRSNTTLEMLGETMKYVGPVARTAGMGLEETAAMAGLLGNVGIKASQAGTTLRAMLQRLAAPTGAAATTLRSLGIEVQDLDGNVRAVPDILGELAAATDDMGSGERLAILKTLFDAEAAAGVAELIEKEGQQGITKFTEILKGASGEAKRVAGQMDANASGGFKAMNSAIEGMKIAFGDLLLPAVRSITSLITALTRRLNLFIEEWPNLSRWVGYVIAGFAGLAFVFSGLMTALAGGIGALVVVRYGVQALGFSGLFSAVSIKSLSVSLFTLAKRSIVFAVMGLKRLTLSLIGLAVKAVPVVIGGLKALTVALMTNPIGLIVGGIALAAGLIVANWEHIGPWFSGLWEGVKGVFNSGWELIKKLFSFSPLGLVMKAWQPMLNWISSKMGWIGDLASGVKSLFSDDTKTPIPKDKKNQNTNGVGRQVTKQAGIAAAVSAAVAVTPAVATKAAPQQTTVTNQYTLQITQQPGESGEALARRVMEQLQSAQRLDQQGAQYDHD